MPLFQWMLSTLGENYQHILTWAVGQDWEEVKFIDWPERITAHTGLVVEPTDSMPLTLSRLREMWEVAKGGKHGQVTGGVVE